MYETPQVIPGADEIRIDYNAHGVEKLLNDLQAAGFEAELLKGDLNVGDLNKKTQEVVASLELPSTTDLISLREFLRAWTP